MKPKILLASQLPWLPLASGRADFTKRIPRKSSLLLSAAIAIGSALPRPMVLGIGGEQANDNPTYVGKLQTERSTGSGVLIKPNTDAPVLSLTIPFNPATQQAFFRLAVP